MNFEAILGQALVAIFFEVSLIHPSFKRVALELSREGAAKLGIAYRSSPAAVECHG